MQVCNTDGQAWGAAHCLQGRCTAFCDLDGQDACGTGQACAPYAGFEDPAGEPVAGLCTPLCDPVTQVRLSDNAPACGSPDPANPSFGCFGDVQAGRFTCAPALAAAGPYGACVDHAVRTWDHDNDPSTAEEPWPSCTTLPNTDANGDGTADHVAWGCGPLPWSG